MKIIWYDVTEIQDWAGHLTGIQRVIFNIGRELSKSADFEMRLCRYDRNYARFVETNYSFIEHEYEPSNAQASEARKVRLRLLRSATPERVKRVARKALKVRSKIGSRDKEPAGIKVSRNDIIFTPGAFWTGYLEALETLKVESGAPVFGIIYDLVPIIVPEFSANVTVHQYKEELPKALKITDQWFAISENSKNDLLDYARKAKINLSKNAVKVIRLGSDIDTHGPSVCPFEQEIPDKFILFVSTLEARKNQMLVYQAVKLAHEKGIKLPPVILVGKHGWLSDEVVSLLKNDRTVSSGIRWYERLDDKGLRWLYQHCLFTVYPSYYEGWGLPVAESLAYKKPCIASRTSSIPEIAGGLINYFSPYSTEELLELMDKLSNNPQELEKANQKAAKYKTDTWQKCCQTITNRINTLG